MATQTSCITPAQPPITSSSNHKENIIDLSKPEPRPTTSVAAPSVAENVPATHEEKQHLAIPVVKLQVDTISDALAARLASSLLAMVLFLKNQVPLPVPQLVRMSGKNSSLKATKQRTELLGAYDTLTSHLTTTFTALSMALSEARDKDTEKPSPWNDRAYLAILLGPSLGTAKAKVFLGVDHLVVDNGRGAEDTTTNGDSESESEESEDESGDESGEEEGPSDSESEGDEEDDEDEDEEDNTDEDDELSQETTLEQHPQKERQSERRILEEPPPKPDALRPRLITGPPPTSYAEEQRFLQNADRLLSRTLASADAEGYGLASDMSTTQTHVLIRAPRNFFHPAWIPRQNVTGTLDTGLKAFLSETTLESTSTVPLPPPQKNAKKQRTEGVWLTTRNGLDIDSPPLALDENDDMIWWSWDGKLVGFSDW